MSNHPTEVFLESQFEAGEELEIPHEPEEVNIFIPPQHVTDPDDEENIDHE